ncbi:MAG TPA: PaaI family thioesterase [Candidatus Methanofastidiosa archaeon]|nr:PaaI family thioesterase [Candidatus Methanofastidiosa archaeon]HPR41714.1 PaaI family thioesterase [Candidatus Methanofastidiosa archaeon]
MDSEKREKLMALMNNDNFSRLCNMSVVEVSEGYSKVRMDLNDSHKNFFGTVHGGAIFSLADMALGAASNSHGKLSMAINCSIHYTKAAIEGTLIAEAKEVAINPRIASYNIKIYDDLGDVVASFQGMVYRKRNDIV